MKPVTFPEVNNEIVPREGDKTKTIPCVLEAGFMLQCWKASFWERILVLFTGNVWFLSSIHEKRGVFLTAIKEDAISTEKKAQKKKKRIKKRKARKKTSNPPNFRPFDSSG